MSLFDDPHSETSLIEVDLEDSGDGYETGSSGARSINSIASLQEEWLVVNGESKSILTELRIHPD